jgi:outer membrane protein assembly factor BamB
MRATGYRTHHGDDMNPISASRPWRLITLVGLALLAPITGAWSSPGRSASADAPAAVELVAASTLTSAPTTGHPGLAVKITGAAFGAAEAVDVYIDTTDTALLVSAADGSFTGTLKMPASASPGTHYFTAIGRRSGAAAQASFKVTTPWVQSGFGAGRAATNPYENTVSTANVAGLGLLWSAADVFTDAAPAVAGGRAFFATYTGISAVSATSGEMLWKSDIGWTVGPPAVAGNLVYAATVTGAVYALNAATGAVLWTQSTGGSLITSPLVANGVVYIGNSNGKFLAMNARTGAVQWTFLSKGRIERAAAFASGLVFVSSSDFTLTALGVADGKVRWSVVPDGSVPLAPTVSKNLVYVATAAGGLYAFQAASGGYAWSLNFDVGALYGMAVANDILIVSSDYCVLALSAGAGNLLWTATSPFLPKGPSIANGVVYLTDETSQLLALALANGAQLWSAGIGWNQYYGSPAVVDGVVYVGTGIGASAFALDAGNDLRTPVAPPSPSSLRPDLRLRVSN